MNLPTFVLSAMLAVAALTITTLAKGPAAATNAAVCAAASLAASLPGSAKAAGRADGDGFGSA